jgi:BlaI family transcriptional regulator, penicillinase repressor
MRKLVSERLSRREKQVMEILYRGKEMTVAEVLEAMTDPPGYSAVRAFLRILEEKGETVHTEVGGRYLYKPSQSYGAMAKTTIQQVVDTLFGGSIESAVATLISGSNRPDDSELLRLEQLIHSVRDKDQDAEDNA